MPRPQADEVTPPHFQSAVDPDPVFYGEKKTQISQITYFITL